MSGWLWGGHGSLAAKARGSGFVSGGCPDVFSSSKLSDVDGVRLSVVL